MKKLFLITILLGFLFTACGGSVSTDSKTTESSVAASTETLHEATLNGVEGLCEMCKVTIEKVAMNTPNIKSAIWDSNTKILVLTSTEEIDLNGVSKAVAEVGYNTEFDKADDSVYDALPSCCKYR